MAEDGETPQPQNQNQDEDESTMPLHGKTAGVQDLSTRRSSSSSGRVHARKHHRGELLHKRSSSSGTIAINTRNIPAGRSGGTLQGGGAFRPKRDAMDAPVRKLSVNLIKTYKHINHLYYEKRKKKAQQQANSDASSSATGGTAKKPSASKAHGSSSNKKRMYNNGYDDEHSDYIIRIEERIKERYIVKQKIGKGSFGQVVKAFDEQNQEHVAVKIIKSRKPFFMQAKTEIELLKEINEKDAEDKWSVVKLLDTFVHHNHQCLVFEMLSYNLYDLLRNTAFQGVSLNLIRKFARQILKSLYFLARDDIDIIHCDLKPENILLRHPKRSAIKVIDFGSSCKSDKQVYQYIQSRFYRSPEVILGRSYSVAIDMWSFGCILIEMHTGEPLFSGGNEYWQLVRFIAIRGMIPEDMLEQGSKTQKFFVLRDSDELGDADSPYGKSKFKLKPSKDGEDPVKLIKMRQQSFHEVLGLDGSGGPGTRRSSEVGHSTGMYNLFIDLVTRMLEYDPEKRITPKQALNHPFIMSDVGNGNGNGEKKACAAEDESQQESQPGKRRSSQRSQRPGSAPAAPAGQILRRSSRVANKQAKQMK